ncbi:MAG: nucleotidyltransferase domain-containing protein [Candidatus Hodarchaeales archaeon]
MASVRGILQRQTERKIKLQASLDSIVAQLKPLGAVKIILFGSFAKDIVDINSDLDLLVIMPPTRTGKEWLALIYDNIERRVASDILAFNQNEFNEKATLPSFISNRQQRKLSKLFFISISNQ